VYASRPGLADDDEGPALGSARYGHPLRPLIPGGQCLPSSEEGNLMQTVSRSRVASFIL
jgi:hypothetical protein